MLNSFRRAFPVLTLLACAGLSLSAMAQSTTRTPELAQAPSSLPVLTPSTAANAIERTLATRDWSRKMWDAARNGDAE